MSKIDELKKEIDSLQKRMNATEDQMLEVGRQLEENPHDKGLLKKWDKAVEEAKQLKAENEELKVKLEEVKEELKEKEPKPPAEPEKKKGKTLHDWLFEKEE